MYIHTYEYTCVYIYTYIYIHILYNCVYTWQSRLSMFTVQSMFTVFGIVSQGLAFKSTHLGFLLRSSLVLSCQDLSRGGAVETGCSDLYGVIYWFTL